MFDGSGKLFSSLQITFGLSNNCISKKKNCFFCSHFTARTIFQLSHFIGLKCYWKWNQLSWEYYKRLPLCYYFILNVLIIYDVRCVLIESCNFRQKCAYVYVIPKIHKRTYLRYITLIGSKGSGLKPHFCWSHAKPSNYVRGNTLTWLSNLSFQVSSFFFSCSIFKHFSC